MVGGVAGGVIGAISKRKKKKALKQEASIRLTQENFQRLKKLGKLVRPKNVIRDGGRFVRDVGTNLEASGIAHKNERVGKKLVSMGIGHKNAGYKIQKHAGSIEKGAGVGAGVIGAAALLRRRKKKNANRRG